MINFRNMSIDDIKDLMRITENKENFACDVSPSTMFLWKDAYNLKVSRYKNLLFRAYEKEGHIAAYFFPIGNGDKFDAVIQIFNDAKERKIKTDFIDISYDAKVFLEKRFPGKFEFEENRNSEDYIYLTQKLADLKGRKYHRKRNNIIKFKNLYSDYCFEIITKENMDDALNVCREWYSANSSFESNGSLKAEYDAIKKAFYNYDELDMFGGILYVNKTAVAMTIGHPINSNVFDVNFEKALKDYTGAYSMVNREFAELLRNYKYLNREEDMGIEGLRKSKLSYYPEMLVKKYNAKSLE